MNRYQREVAKMDRRHSIAVRALSFAGICCLAAFVLWSLWGRQSESPVEVPTTATGGTAAEPALAGVTTVGVNAQQASNPAARRLHLAATSPGRHPLEGTAALGPDIANPRVMSAGALLENGAVLREIHSDHVVIERDGKRTDLYIEGVATRTKPAENSELLTLAESPPSVRKPATAAPATYTEILRGAPHYVENELIGFEVYRGTNSGQFSRLGLQSGDVLAAVDGVPITTQDALATALKDLSEGRSLLASVIRADQTVELVLDGAVLTQSASAVVNTGPLQP